MSDVIQMLALPFLASIILGTILGYLGTHVLRREVIFIDISLAQFAAVGSLAAHLAFEAHEGSLLEYTCAFAFICAAALFYAWTRKKIYQISLEVIIGVSYAIAFAAALFMVGISAGGHVHVQEMLAGGLLWVTYTDIILCSAFFVLIGLCFFIFRRPFNRISNNYDQALSEKVNVVWWDFLFYALMGIVITLSVRVAGVIMVFAYLIIPATITSLFTLRFAWQFTIIITVLTISSLAGLLFAYYLGFSLGPPIGMFMGVILIIVAVVRRLLSRTPAQSKTVITQN